VENVHNPLAWLGAGVVLGATSWPWIQADWAECAVGLVLTAVLTWMAPTRPTVVLGWTIGGLWLGTLSCAVQPQPISHTAATHLVGEVVRANRRWTWVHTAGGRVAMRTGWDRPPMGRRIAAWTTPWSPDPVLPGARDPTRNDPRTGTIRRRLRRWVVLDGAEPEADDAARWDPAKHGGLLRSLATGQRDQIDPDTREIMRRTGTVHLLAISGLHVGLVAMTAWGLATLLLRPMALMGSVWLHRLLAMLVGLAGAAAYASTVGWPASAQRAMWMVGTVMIARTVGRRVRPFNLLGAAATIVVLWNPGQVGELGFQLSFSAVVGIVLWAPWFTVPSSAPRIKRWVMASVGATVGATLGTLPFAAWDFQLLAPASIPANLIAAPLIGTIAVPAALVAAHFDGALGLVALAIGDTAVDLGVTALSALNIRPWSPAVGPLGALALGACALLGRRPLWAALLAVACLVQVPSSVDRLIVTFPAVGQGSAALIAWPDGRHWLVDGGPQTRAVLHWLRREGIRHLDTVFLTHPHPDHIKGLLPIIQQLEVDTLVARDRPQRRRGIFHDLWRDAAQRGTYLRTLRTPHPAIIHPSIDWVPPRTRRTNNQSLVLRFAHGAHSFLLTGDIEAKGEAHLLPQLTPTTVVQVPHHGSQTSSTPDFVQRLSPRWAVIPVGPGNQYGHPASAVLARWGPARVLRTDIEGSIRFSTDGQDLEVDRWTARTGWKPVARAPVPPPRAPLTSR
jgi:competence protein ComEC